MKETTWVKGWSGSPARRAQRATSFAHLLRAVGRECIPFPIGQPEEEVVMARREALARVLWTRALSDGNLVAIRLLLDHLAGARSGETEKAEAALRFTADDAARAEALLQRWAAELGASGDVPDATEGQP